MNYREIFNNFRKNIFFLFISFALIFTFNLALTQNVFAATFNLDSKAGDPGTTLTLPLDLTSESLENPAGVSLYLNYDPSVISYDSASIGNAASEAGKSLNASPLSASRVAIIIFGFNTITINDGTIANITFSIANDASGTTLVDIEDSTATITDADLNSIPITSIVDGVITIGSAENDPPTAEANGP